MAKKIYTFETIDSTNNCAKALAGCWAEQGTVVFANALTDPDLNYSTQTFDARDGTAFVVALDDALFHPHRGTTTLPDLTTYQTVTHFRMTCSLAAPVLTAPTPGASVKPAKLRRADPDDPLDPELQPSPGPTARNLHYQLHTGLLGAGGGQ